MFVRVLNKGGEGVRQRHTPLKPELVNLYAAGGFYPGSDDNLCEDEQCYFKLYLML